MNDRQTPDMDRVMVIGFPKSGTSTIHKAFQSAGLLSAHWLVPEGFCGQVIYRDFHNGRNPLHRLRRFDCITQSDVCLTGWYRHYPPVNFWPQLDFEILARIREYEPRTKFILNRRNVDDLIRSIDGWGSFRQRMIECDIPGLPPGAGETDAEMRAWIEGHYAACEAFFAGSDRFLDFAVPDADAHARLADFVGKELPWWGVANSRSTPQEPGSSKEPAKRPARKRGAKAAAKRAAAKRIPSLVRWAPPARPAAPDPTVGWTTDDVFALGALRPMGEAFLPWTGTGLSPSDVLNIVAVLDMNRPGLILELGTGWSTVMLARYARYRQLANTQIISVDHDRARQRLIRAYLEHEKLVEQVDLVSAPREPWTPSTAGTDGAGLPKRWYATAPIKEALGTEKIDVLVVAGPDGREPFARYPAAVELRDNLADRLTVVLQAPAKVGQEVATRWKAQTDLEFTSAGGSATLHIGQRTAGGGDAAPAEAEAPTGSDVVRDETAA